LVYKYFIIALLLPFLINGQVSESTEFSLLTVAHGTDAYNIFGHTGLRISDRSRGLDEVYNYGTFDIDTDNFEIQFLRGRLKYRIAKQSYKSFLQVYYHEGRAVNEQRLNLDNASRQKLYSFIINNYKPENRYYLYDFFFDNCATRVRDIFETEFTNSQYVGLTDLNITYRQLLDEYLQGLDWTDFGIDLIIGSVADAQADHRGAMFLPTYLHDFADKITYTNEAGQTTQLVSSDEIVLPLDISQHQSYVVSPLIFFSFLAFLELLLFLFRKKINGESRMIKFYDILCYIAMSIVSLVVMIMWFGTDHDACAQNYNLLWANPLFILLTGALLLNNNNNKLLFLCSTFLVITLLLWTIIPQQIHVAILPIIILIILKNARMILAIQQTMKNRAQLKI